MNTLLALSICCTSLVVLSECANVLIIFPSASKSHSILAHSLGHGLLHKGHNVTILSPYPLNEQLPHYHDLELTNTIEAWAALMTAIGGKTNTKRAFETMVNFFKHTAKITEVTLQEVNVQKILQSDSKFDVVIISPVFNDALFAIGHHFNAPVILYSTVGPSYFTNYIVGNPSEYAYVPDWMLPFPDRMTFVQRLINTGFQMFANTLQYFIHYPAQDEILRKYFPNAPNAYSIQQLVSVVFTNSQRCLDYARPLVPNIIEVGGLHIEKPKPLSNDLQKFMDDATDGVIYVSFGTNIQSAEMPNETKHAFVDVFTKLKQKVLWKWDESTISGLSKNVRLGRWFPQSDILAHPNVKLFITHGGLLSTIETVTRGVPCLGIPIFADQLLNMQKAEAFGFAVRVNFKNVTVESLQWALKEILLNSKYKSAVVKLSSVLKDQLVSPLDKAVYWVESVIQHKGASHLRSVGADIPLYQYLLLDVVGFFLLVLVSILSILYFVMKLSFRYLRRRFCQTKSKKD